MFLISESFRQTNGTNFKKCGYKSAIEVILRDLFPGSIRRRKGGLVSAGQLGTSVRSFQFAGSFLTRARFASLTKRIPNTAPE